MAGSAINGGIFQSISATRRSFTKRGASRTTSLKAYQLQASLLPAHPVRTSTKRSTTSFLYLSAIVFDTADRRVFRCYSEKFSQLAQIFSPIRGTVPLPERGLSPFGCGFAALALGPYSKTGITKVSYYPSQSSPR